jgi:hypothetical protein
MVDTLELWWMMERARFREKDKKWFDGLVSIAGYALWKNMNAWCFQNAKCQHPAIELSTLILEEIEQLRRLRKGDLGVHNRSERE